MNSIGRKLMIGLVGVSLIGLWGCDVEVEPGYGYRYYDSGPYVDMGPYYYDGYYDGPNWYWHDRDGHWFHEGRDVHERRFNAYRARGGGERGHAESHGGHDNHR